MENENISPEVTEKEETIEEVVESETVAPVVKRATEAEILAVILPSLCKCNACGTNFLMRTKAICPLCHSADVSKEKKEAE